MANRKQQKAKSGKAKASKKKEKKSNESSAKSTSRSSIKAKAGAKTSSRVNSKVNSKVSKEKAAKDKVEKKTSSAKKSQSSKQEKTSQKKEVSQSTVKQETVASTQPAPEQKKGSSLIKEDLSPTNANRERLIVTYAPLIKYIAQRIAARLPANIELDDLISSGVIGLMDAIDKYDASRDNKFKTYAEFRIRGAILDELRAQDWVPRSVREKAKQLERCYAKIEQEKGRQATDEEVCEVLGISQDEYYELLNQVRSVSLLSFDDFASFSKADKRSIQNLSQSSNSGATPFSEVSVAALKNLVADAIKDLPEKQRLVLSLYYFEDLNLKEIGRVLDVTESRVSQLHTQAILRLKGKLRNHWDDLAGMLG